MRWLLLLGLWPGLVWAQYSGDFTVHEAPVPPYYAAPWLAAQRQLVYNRQASPMPGVPTSGILTDGCQYEHSSQGLVIRTCPVSYNTLQICPDVLPEPSDPRNVNVCYRVREGVVVPCWRAQGQPEMCAGEATGTLPNIEQPFKMATCNRTTRDSDWYDETGRVTLTCEETGAFRTGAMLFAPNIASCVQRETALHGGWDADGSLRIRIDFETSATSGTVTWSAAVGCAQRGVQRVSQHFNQAQRGTAAITKPATSPQSLSLSNLDVTNCRRFQPIYLRLCKEAQTLLPNTTDNEVHQVKVFLTTLTIPQKPQ